MESTGGQLLLALLLLVGRTSNVEAFSRLA